MNEFEIKFLIDKQSAREIWARARASGLADGGPTTKTLRSIYLDTAGHALNKAGIALRLRRDGRRWFQTVKTRAALHGGLSQAGEVENPAPGGRLCLDAIPDTSVRQEIIHLLDGAPLQPICETVMRRATSELVLQSGTRAECAVDVGEVLAGGRSAELSELEIELRAGDLGELFDIAQMLVPAGGLRFSRLSKAARGYLLAAEGRIDVALAPQNARDVALNPTQTTEQAARDILRECFDQIAANVTVVRRLDDVEGPHRLRVGLRRLRSVFSVYAPVLQSPEMSRLNDEARWLGQEVGGLRDLDVVANDIVRRESAANSDELGLSALADELVRRADERRERLRRLLAGSRVQAFLIDLARFVETRGWLVPQDFDQTSRLGAQVKELAGQALNRRWKRIIKRAPGLESLTAEQRHDLRKELKKLRYAVEFFSSLFPQKHVDPFLKRLKQLQTVFGDLNDAQTVRALFVGGNYDDICNPRTQRAIGWIMGVSQVRAEYGWAGVDLLWRDLKHTRPHWR